MAETDPLVIAIKLKTDDLQKQMQGVQGELSKLGQKVKSSGSDMDNFKGKINAVGGAMLKAFVGVAAVKFLADSGKAAADDAQSMALLANQIKATTGASDAQIGALEGQISALEQMSGVADDEIRPALAGLVRATGDTTKAMQLQKLAMDISAGTGKDLGAVSHALAKAYNGNSAALTRLVPGVKGAKDQMGYLSSTFKGAAQAAADANPYKTLKVTLDNVKETLGKALMPLIRVFAKLLQDLSPVITILAKIIGQLVKALMPVIQQIAKALIPILGPLAKVILTVVKALTPLINHLVKALLPILPPLIKLFMVIVNAVLPPIIKLLDKVLIPILNFLVGILTKYLIPYWTKLANVFGKILQPVIDFVIKGFQNLMKILGPIWENVLKPIIDGIMNLLGIKAEPEVKVKAKVDTSETDALSGDLSGNFDGSSTSGSDTGAKKENPLVQYLKDTNKAILKANGDYQKEVSKAQDDYQKMITDKINSFREAFASATKTSITDIFSQGATSANAMIDQLKRKLEATKNFSKDLAALAAQGYSAEFVQQIAAAGPQMGDAMAQQLLGSTPEQAKELQDLFSQNNIASATGVDSVAEGFRDQFSKDTQALNAALDKAASALVATLAKIDSGLTTKLKGSSSSDLKAVKTDLGTTRNSLKTSQVAAQHIETHVNVQTNASPVAIADATVNSIKFGLPVTAAPAQTTGDHL